MYPFLLFCALMAGERCPWQHTSRGTYFSTAVLDSSWCRSAAHRLHGVALCSAPVRPPGGATEPCSLRRRHTFPKLAHIDSGRVRHTKRSRKLHLFHPPGRALRGLETRQDGKTDGQRRRPGDGRTDSSAGVSCVVIGGAARGPDDIPGHKGGAGT